MIVSREDGLIGHAGDLTDEGLVDLERINGNFSEIAQAGITRSEVIDCQLYSSCPQDFEDGFGGVNMPHKDVPKSAKHSAVLAFMVTNPGRTDVDHSL
jgi:hypothetical protein